MSAHNGDGRDRAESMSIDADSMTKRDRVIPKTEIVKVRFIAIMSAKLSYRSKIVLFH